MSYVSPESFIASGRTAMPTITFNVNGENRSIDIDPSTPLLWALRDSLSMLDAMSNLISSCVCRGAK